MPTKIETRLLLASQLQRLADRVTRGEFGEDGGNQDASGKTVEEYAQAHLREVIEEREPNR